MGVETSDGNPHGPARHAKEPGAILHQHLGHCNDLTAIVELPLGNHRFGGAAF